MFVRFKPLSDQAYSLPLPCGWLFTALIVWHVAPLMDVCRLDKVALCFHQALSRQWDRLSERAEHPIPSHREIKQPYHVTMQERKKRLLFTSHTSTLFHLTPGSSKACWVADTPRKMDLSNLRSKHINYPRMYLSTCMGSRFQFSWDFSCRTLLHTVFKA